MSIFDLTGKKAIVTGGSRGLGHGMAEGLMEAGCEVVIIGTRESIKDRAAEFNQKGLKCTGVQADLGDEIALKEAFRESLAALGGHLDILVTAHGVQSRHPSEEFPMEDWKRVLDVNLTAVFELCQLAAKQFMAQESKGKIITVASMLSFFGGYTVPAYAASKGGIYSLTHALALSLAQWHITVNSISPGWIETRDYEQLRPEDHAQHPSGRVGKPEDIARLCLFICQEENDFMNGENVTIDGGMTKKMIYIE